MPSKSPAQARTMRAAAHDEKFADKLGIPQKVAREFENADERKKHAAKKAIFDRTFGIFRGAK